MRRWGQVAVVGLAVAFLWFAAGAALLLVRPCGAGEVGPAAANRAEYAGSVSCRQCHERFYELWASSHHGLAMQPYTTEFARANLTAQTEPIRIGAYEYRAIIDGESGWVREKGPKGPKRYPLVHVMGGKNVYYFLTPMQGGRLQTLPVAYDVRTGEWFDTAASGVRHFPGTETDEPVHWTDPMYTFNTSCYGCHVSQLSSNYDLKSDTYHTTWAEPGINCEACHGSGAEHVRVCQATPEGQEPNDLKIIVTKTFSADQINSMCNACHAKLSPITGSFKPGQRFFDHFDLITLDHSDFYPDGRDLGENYTMTTWRMSPCVKSGKLDCAHCHTSSGRYRFKNAEQPNAACLPCHRERVENVAAHSHHEADGTGSRCIACHMPMTDFARMTRSDHSMRPPTPAATLKFKSPNACNICHDDQDPNWADGYVRQWHEKDYQKPILKQASLVDAARRGDWSRLDAILTYIGSKDRDEVFATSLLRLLAGCESEKKWPAVIKALEKDRSPLVRAAAAQTLHGYLTAESFPALLAATDDEYRLVRVRAAAALAAIPPEQLADEHRNQLRRATAELMESLKAAPDDYSSHFNLGNVHMQRQDHVKALASYERAIKLRPDFVPPYVNAAFAYNARGQNDKAEASFRKALALDPNNAAVHLNLGMLLGELKRPREAEGAFRDALKADPNAAAAAYNLGVLLSESKPKECLTWCRKAYELRPNEGRYGYTYAFFLRQNGQVEQAIRVLRKMVNAATAYPDAYLLLGEVLEKQGKVGEALSVYRRGSQNKNLTPRDRYRLEMHMQRLMR